MIKGKEDDAKEGRKEREKGKGQDREEGIHGKKERRSREDNWEYKQILDEQRRDNQDERTNEDYDSIQIEEREPKGKREDEIVEAKDKGITQEDATHENVVGDRKRKAKDSKRESEREDTRYENAMRDRKKGRREVKGKTNTEKRYTSHKKCGIDKLKHQVEQVGNNTIPCFSYSAFEELQEIARITQSNPNSTVADLADKLTKRMTHFNTHLATSLNSAAMKIFAESNSQITKSSNQLRRDREPNLEAPTKAPTKPSTRPCDWSADDVERWVSNGKDNAIP